MHLPSLSSIRAIIRSPTPTHVLFVDRSIVPCPVRGDVDFELCLACPFLREVRGDPIDRIVCERRVPMREPELVG